MEGMEVYMYVLALDGYEWLGSCPDHFAPWKEPQVQSE